MIAFQVPDPIRITLKQVEHAARQLMRPAARHYDRHEGDTPWDYIRAMHQAVRAFGGISVAPTPATAGLHYQRLAHIYEMLSWGDAGLYLCAPRGGLGAAAVEAAGTSDQKARLLARLEGDQPVHTAMAITEAHAGSDTSAIRTSDTATILLRDCRIPLENMLGSTDPQAAIVGYRAVLMTFDATRPLVAASALGIARAALEFLRQTAIDHGITPRSGLPRSRLTNLERELVDLEALWRSAWLLVIKAAWAADAGRRNTLEAAMAKVRVGEAVVRITQKAIELLGPMGLTQEHLLEKWFRDAKINDLYEGTGQINRLIVARQLLGYSRRELS